MLGISPPEHSALVPLDRTDENTKLTPAPYRLAASIQQVSVTWLGRLTAVLPPFIDRCTNQHLTYTRKRRRLHPVPSTARRTLLCQLANERHWQTHETFVLQFQRVAQQLAATDNDPRFKT